MTSAPTTRVTYSNVNDDFSAVQDWLDSRRPAFEGSLGGRFPNVIGGADDSDGEAYEVRSPIDTDIVLGHFVDASDAAVKRAVAAARAAQPAWAARPWQERVSILRWVADRLAEHKYELTLAAIYEVGKSRMEALGEVEEAVDLARFFADEMERNQGYGRELKRALPNERTASVMRPYGVFGVIAPFNFSVALSVKMMSPALVAGNTVVFKPSEGGGLTGSWLMRCFNEGGLPAGVLNMVCGEQAGPRLVDADGVAGIAFTGSHEVGMSIYRQFAVGPYARPVIAEMGGKNPAYVTASADL
ncbi:MAG: aldehyde dehydrogenase family protein, partial [Planctomycetes bacterium]|nr:aldehyde dehydrogenase family protein [Planctomycetota bacterium]